MKVNSKIYKGIEYVQLSELPEDQRKKISESLDEETLIKILIGEKIITNCILYKDYECWFETFYSRTPVVISRNVEVSETIEMALGKA